MVRKGHSGLTTFKGLKKRTENRSRCCRNQVKCLLLLFLTASDPDTSFLTNSVESETHFTVSDCVREEIKM